MRAGCNGPCQQGRVPCPTPEACEVEVEEPMFYGRQWLREAVYDAALVLALVGLLMAAVVAVVMVVRS